MTLGTDLGIAAAASLCERLRAGVGSGLSCAVEGGAVAVVSTACVQLLLAADTALQTSGRRLSLVAPSDTLRNSLIDLGLGAALARWEAHDE